jgi:signal transduction histidine kinase
VFQTVAEEAGRLLAARTAATVRFDQPDAVVVGSWNDGEGRGIEIGTLVPYSDPDSPVYRASHEGGRVDDYADLAGEAARLTRLAGYRSSVAAPITAASRLWGALFVFSVTPHHFRPDAQQRLADFTNLVALALESAEAHDQLTASRARIVEAGLAERRRLERNLHDGAQQHLVALAVKLGLARQLVDGDRDALATLLEELRGDAQTTLTELRELAHGIYPPLLMDRGLREALVAAANRSLLHTEVEADIGRYPSDIEAAIYFCCLEALQNAGKHAGAGAVVKITLTESDGVLRFEVADDGAGFDAKSSAGRGHGFVNMADRLGAIGGKVAVDSAPGEGTRISGMVPLAGHEPEEDQPSQS